MSAGKGGKNRRRGKNEGEEKRELIHKEDGQGTLDANSWVESHLHFPPALIHCTRHNTWHGVLGAISRFQHFRKPGLTSFRNAEYAKVKRMLGNGRLEAYCFDGKDRQCHIRGKMRKKVC
jgi:translation initiation factor 1A